MESIAPWDGLRSERQPLLLQGFAESVDTELSEGVTAALISGPHSQNAVSRFNCRLGLIDRMRENQTRRPALYALCIVAPAEPEELCRQIGPFLRYDEPQLPSGIGLFIYRWRFRLENSMAGYHLHRPCAGWRQSPDDLAGIRGFVSWLA